MKNALRTGFGFGLTSGIITTLGLMIGLHSGTNSKLAIIAGVITIAIADACSDALGIHISEESKDAHSQAHVWIATMTTFISKFFMAIMFLIPLILLPLHTAIAASVIWGVFLVGVFSYYIAKGRGDSPVYVILEHITITVFVIAVAHYVPAYLQTWVI